MQSRVHVRRGPKKGMIIFWCDIVVVVDLEQLLLEWMKLCINYQLNMSLSVLSMQS